jgi:predicted Rossmann-fold nucleotide-binding protein
MMSDPIRVIVCGGRDYANRSAVGGVLGILRDGTTIVHGAAPGADSLAAEEAALRGLDVEAHPADWAAHGRAAGPIRNQRMLDAGAELVIAFPGGRGTADMVRRSREAGIVVLTALIGDDDE